MVRPEKAERVNIGRRLFQSTLTAQFCLIAEVEEALKITSAVYKP